MIPRSAPIMGTYNFTFMATDPDGHEVYYWIELGDGSSDGWIGPDPSGEEITRNHTWYKYGTYTIKAKAKDIYGAEGAWGELSIPIKRNKVINFLSLRLLARFPKTFPITQQLLYM